MKQFLLVGCLLFSMFAHGQSEQEKQVSKPPPVYTYVEQMPEPGYDIAKYLSAHLKYPDSAIANNIQGRVILKFIVNEDGSMTDCKVQKGIGGGCDEEAMSIMRGMPNWKAGMQNGKPVKVWTLFPVSFALEEPEKVYDKLYDHLDQDPVAGYDYSKFILEHVRYPDSARTNKIQGDVYLLFIVNKDGSIGDCDIRRSLGAVCDQEAKRVVKSMPNWRPGIYNALPVKVFEIAKVPFYPTEEDRIRAESEKIYTYMEQMPGPGYDFNQYISKNLQYPLLAQKANIQGVVYVQFVVNADGSISDARILKGIGNGCDEEALQVIANMPAWIPGKQNSKTVRAYYTQPITFALK